jgi:hypothetical protein
MSGRNDANGTFDLAVCNSVIGGWSPSRAMSRGLVLRRPRGKSAERLDKIVSVWSPGGNGPSGRSRRHHGGCSPQSAVDVGRRGCRSAACCGVGPMLVRAGRGSAGCLVGGCSRGPRGSGRSGRARRFGGVARDPGRSGRMRCRGRALRLRNAVSPRISRRKSQIDLVLPICSHRKEQHAKRSLPTFGNERCDLLKHWWAILGLNQ